MYMYKELTSSERELLDSISQVRYGELVDVEIPNGEAEHKDCPLTSQQMALIEIIRAGIRHFDCIKIHQGEPAMAEVSMTTEHGFRAVQKIKF